MFAGSTSHCKHIEHLKKAAAKRSPFLHFHVHDHPDGISDDHHGGRNKSQRTKSQRTKYQMMCWDFVRLIIIIFIIIIIIIIIDLLF